MDPDELRSVVGSTSLSLGARDETWDAGAARKALHQDDYSKAFFYRDPSGDPATLAAYKLPFASPSGGLHAVWGGVTAAAQRLSSLQGVSDSDIAGIKKKIAVYYRKAASKYDDDTIQVPWSSGSSATGGDVEMRYCVAPITHVDVRDTTGNGDDTWTMSGYAAVFNQQTLLYDGKFVRITEDIDPGAFDELLRSQALGQPDGVVHFNFGHDMNRAVAATDVTAGQPGSLALRADSHGLNFLAKVPRDDPDGVAMAVKMRTGVLRQASFAFTVDQADWTTTENAEGPDEDHRRITRVRHLYDVCATAQGAYPQTVSQLRSYAAGIGQLAALFGEGQPHHPGLRGASTINSDREGGRGDSRARRTRELEAMRMQVAVAESHHSRRTR